MRVAIPLLLLIVVMGSGCVQDDIIIVPPAGGGGGVSFDGNPVNVNGSLLFNSSINQTNASMDFMNNSIINVSSIILKGNDTKRLQINYYPNGSIIMVEI